MYRRYRKYKKQPIRLIDLAIYITIVVFVADFMNERVVTPVGRDVYEHHKDSIDNAYDKIVNYFKRASEDLKHSMEKAFN